MNVQKLYVSATDLTEYVKEQIQGAIERTGMPLMEKGAIPGNLYVKEWDWVETSVSGDAEKFAALLSELFTINSEVIVSKTPPSSRIKMEEDALWVEIYNDYRE